MKPQTAYVSVLALMAIAVIAFMAFGSGGPSEKASAPPPAATATGQVSSGGVTLASVSVDFGDDKDVYPPGPEADVMNANCTVCHSASMARTQPPLSQADWEGEVKKMRETYKATINDRDVPAIVAYLTRMSQQLPPLAHPGAAPKSTGAAGAAG